MKPNVFDGLRAVADLLAAAEKASQNADSFRGRTPEATYRKLLDENPDLSEVLDQVFLMQDLLIAHSNDYPWSCG